MRFGIIALIYLTFVVSILLAIRHWLTPLFFPMLVLVHLGVVAGPIAIAIVSAIDSREYSENKKVRLVFWGWLGCIGIVLLIWATILFSAFLNRA